LEDIVSSGILSNRVGIVTGAGSGIGRGIALQCARAGAHIVVADINESSAKSVCKEIAGEGGTAVAVTCDVSNEESASSLVSRTADEYGRIDILVNNAFWHAGYCAAEDVSVADFDHCMRVGAYGTLYLSQRVFPYMKDSGGRIINIGSEMSDQPLFGRIAYASMKGAVRSMTKACARDWGSYGITVNMVWPNAVTPGWESFAAAHPEEEAKVLADMALHRPGSPIDDVAPVVVFLASESARWITGQTLVANGGRTML
jgi:NAD(P)-dependent dehydrogenase (short-subunit alcohol dehydrogenase family)